METLRTIRNVFWDSNFWLPQNVTWDDIQSDDWLKYTNINLLYWLVPVALVLLMVKFVLKEYCFSRLGVYLGVKPTRYTPLQSNEVLEILYRSKNHLKYEEIEMSAKKLDLSVRQIQKWLHVRRMQDEPSELSRFCDVSWFLICYTISLTYGVVSFWDQPWLWNIKYCWYGYPHQGVPLSASIYYMFYTSFYISLLFSHIYKYNLKNFWDYLIHHIATIIMLVVSWICNLHRMGIVTSLLHDCSDILICLGKLTHYTGYKTINETIFFVFVFVWLITRVIIFPMCIMRSGFVDFPEIITMFPAAYIFIIFSCTLTVLHMHWTYVIFVTAYKTLILSDVEQDNQSTSLEVESNVKKSN